MAKQIGVHKLHGKVDDQSYYYSKNGGYQSRKINPGMSAAVKNSAAYANTRLNNAEFGACGACAGAMIRPITQRWRFILDSIATGKLVKAMKEAMAQDNTSAWGKRLIPQAQMAIIQDAFNAFSKNQVPSEIKSAIGDAVYYNSATQTIVVDDGVFLSPDMVQEYIAKGASGMAVKAFAFTVTAPTISVSGEGYARPYSLLVELSSVENTEDFVSGGNCELLSDGMQTNAPAILNDTSHFGGILVIMLPYKKVGTNVYTLQELCSAVWVPAKAGSPE